MWCFTFLHFNVGHARVTIKQRNFDVKPKMNNLWPVRLISSQKHYLIQRMKKKLIKSVLN